MYANKNYKTDGNVYYMPNKIFDENFSPHEFMIYCFLVSVGDSKGVSFWSVPKMARTTSGWHSRTSARSRHNPIDAETPLNHIGSEAFLLYIDLFYLAYWGSGIFIEQYHIFPFREYCA